MSKGGGGEQKTHLKQKYTEMKPYILRMDKCELSLLHHFNGNESEHEREREMEMEPEQMGKYNIKNS